MKTLCLLAAGLLLLLPGYTQSAWKLKKSVDDLQVYARTPEGTDFQEIKVICTVEAPLTSIVAIINDVAAAPEWAYGCTKTRLIEQISDTETISYGTLDFPFPLQNRDFVTKTTLWQNSRTKEVFIRMTNLPDYLPKERRHVRIPQLSINWRLKPISAKRVEIHYAMQSDPGGMIPAWLMNRVIDKGPVHSMQAFEKLLQKSKYRNASLRYIQEFSATEDRTSGKE